MKKPRYSNDKKAPRMKKAKFSTRVISNELWKKFIKQHPEYKELGFKEFYNLWVDIAETIQKETVENPLGLKLGSYLGELKVQFLPYHLERDDHNASEILGQRIAATNLTQKGKGGKIKWERRWAVKYNKILQYYAFEADRKIMRLAGKYIAENPEKIRISRNTLGGKSVWRSKIKRLKK